MQIYKKFLLFLSLAFALQGSASAAVRVAWDCYLPIGPVTCTDLRSAYFGSMKMMSAVPQDKAQILLRARVIGIQDGYQYKADFVGGADLPQFTILSRISSDVSGTATLLRVLGVLQKGTAPFLEVMTPYTVGGPVATLVLSDPSASPQVRPDRKTGWYFSPSLSGTIAKSQPQMITVMGNANLNFSDEGSPWRFQVVGSVDYRRMTVPVEGGEDLEAETFNYGAYTVISYSFARRWSVAAITIGKHQPSANLDSQFNAAVGLEWNLTPFLKTNDRTIAVRYTIGPEYQNYVSPNKRGNDEELYLRHSIYAYFAWHFKKLETLSITLGASSPIADYQYVDVFADASVNIKITNDLSIRPTLSIGYRPGQLNEPAAQDFSNPLETYMGGGFSQVYYNASLTLIYTFGNSLLRSQDQRWTNF